jgi:hypothetical protein
MTSGVQRLRMSVRRGWAGLPGRSSWLPGAEERGCPERFLVLPFLAMLYLVAKPSHVGVDSLVRVVRKWRGLRVDPVLRSLNDLEGLNNRYFPSGHSLRVHELANGLRLGTVVLS